VGVRDQSSSTCLLIHCAFLHSLRGIGAVVYRVPGLENDRLLKISLRSVENEDTTPISEVVCLFIYSAK
jgi:hypothetical protein